MVGTHGTISTEHRLCLWASRGALLREVGQAAALELERVEGVEGRARETEAGALGGVPGRVDQGLVVAEVQDESCGGLSSGAGPRRLWPPGGAALPREA